jgi:hypothetical protein
VDAYLIVGAVVLAASVSLVIGFELARMQQRPRVPTVEEPRAARRHVHKGHARSQPTAEPRPRPLRPRDSHRDAAG